MTATFRFAIPFIVLLLSGLIGYWRVIVVSHRENLLGKMSQRTGGGEPKKKELSVVVPCYEEALNIRPLCTRLFAATKKANLEVELILVDDYSGKGSEDTKKVVQELKKEGFKIDLITRMPEQGKGLCSAVIHGFKVAKYAAMLCMDADLQHEPESVPEVAAPILNGEAEFSVGSRHVQGGSQEEFPLFRRIVSYGATALAFPLSPCSDPMSGFFSISKEAFERGVDKLNPLGYKIGLELMVRCNCSPITEVPIRFRDREAGESKLSTKQYIYYLLHLANLYWFKFPGLIILFFLLTLAVLCVLVTMFLL